MNEIFPCPECASPLDRRKAFEREPEGLMLCPSCGVIVAVADMGDPKTGSIDFGP